MAKRLICIVFVTSVLVFENEGRPAQSCGLTMTPDVGIKTRPGQSVAFECDARCLGHSLLRYQLQWRDPHGNIVPRFGGNRVHTVSYNRWRMSRLIVESARLEDSGSYTCHIQHNGSLLQYPVALRVETPPRETDDGRRRGDIYVEPEPEFGNIRPAREASRNRRHHRPGISEQHSKSGNPEDTNLSPQPGAPTLLGDVPQTDVMREKRVRRAADPTKPGDASTTASATSASTTKQDVGSSTQKAVSSTVSPTASSPRTPKPATGSDAPSSPSTSSGGGSSSSSSSSSSSPSSGGGSSGSSSSSSRIQPVVYNMPTQPPPIMDSNSTDQSMLTEEKSTDGHAKRSVDASTDKAEDSSEAFGKPTGEGSKAYEDSTMVTKPSVFHGDKENMTVDGVGVDLSTQEDGDVTSPSTHGQGVTVQGTSQTDSPTTQPIQTTEAGAGSAGGSGSGSSGSGSSGSGSSGSGSSGSGSSSSGSSSSGSGSSSGSDTDSGSGTGKRETTPDGGAVSKQSTADGGETTWGRVGLVWFSLALVVIILLMLGIVLYCLYKRCYKKRREHDLSTSAYRDDRGMGNGSDDRGNAVLLMGERPHKPLAPLSSATGLNGEYITSVDLDTQPAPEKEVEKASTSSDESQEGEGEEDKPQESFVSTFMIGRLSSSKQSEGDEVVTANPNATTNDDNVFAPPAPAPAPAAAAAAATPSHDKNDGDNTSSSSSSSSSSSDDDEDEDKNSHSSEDTNPADLDLDPNLDPASRGGGEERRTSEIHLQVKPEGILVTEKPFTDV